MSLHKEWSDMVVEYVKNKGEKAFWAEYAAVEEAVYRDILPRHAEKPEFVIAEMAAQVESTPQFIMGILDGINESLREPLELDSLEEASRVRLDIDLEALYYNMLDAQADYLYSLPQWDAIFSKEKRQEIKKRYLTSKTGRNEEKIGRNDPCPCGSGKKYKKCHGAAGQHE